MILYPGGKFTFISVFKSNLDDTKLARSRILAIASTCNFTFLPIISWENQFITNLVVIFGIINIITVQPFFLQLNFLTLDTLNHQDGHQFF